MTSISRGANMRIARALPWADYRTFVDVETAQGDLAVQIAEEANAYMRGDAFSSNPIGVNFDPDELVEQFKKGVPEQQLLARPEGPPAPIPREHGLGA
jgi:hypothetical protein